MCKPHFYCWNDVSSFTLTVNFFFKPNELDKLDKFGPFESFLVDPFRILVMNNFCIASHKAGLSKKAAYERSHRFY